jgi:hypothetical protein
MMPNLSKIYDNQFFQEWGPHNTGYVNSAKKITDVLYEQFHPQTLIDVGCGCGVYAHFFTLKGTRVTAIDGVEPPGPHRFPIPIEILDVTEPLPNKWDPFDVTLCLEVAEHIPGQHVNTFLKNISGLGDTLILSAAPPNQGGHHHVNEQPKRYWVEKLAQFGMVYNRRKTGALLEIFKKDKMELKWMSEQISVYEKLNKNNPSHHELAFAIPHPGKTLR